MNSLVSRWQTLFGQTEPTREALAEVQAERDDTITYLSTLRVVMEILEQARNFDQACQEIAGALVVEIGAETCVLASRDRPEDTFRLRGFASQSQRLGESEPASAVAESTWLATAALVVAAGRPAFYTQTSEGGFVAVEDPECVSGLLGLPLLIGGERNGVIILEYLSAPVQHFARRPALALVADIIGGALTIARSRDGTERVLGDLEREAGAARDVLTEREKSLREKEDDVVRLTQALIHSNQAKRQFLGTLSHELRTPLNAILGYSELLHDGLVGPVTREQMGMLQRVMVSTRHLTQLIDDMLFFVQLESNQAPVRETFPVADLVSEAASSVPERFSRSQAELRVEIAPGAETIWCDRTLLKRVVFQLLSNGFKFTETGEVRFIAMPWESGSGIVIVVRDTGVGMSPERLEEIFQLFSQIDMSNTRRFSGLGLGLALVKRCVQILDGTIAVRSAPGEGTELTIHLPATDPAQQAAEQTSQAQQ